VPAACIAQQVHVGRRGEELPGAPGGVQGHVPGGDLEQAEAAFQEHQADLGEGGEQQPDFTSLCT